MPALLYPYDLNKACCVDQMVLCHQVVEAVDSRYLLSASHL